MQALEELGITEPSEIDVEAIAFHYGAEVRYTTVDGCEASIFGYKDRAIVSVNKYASRPRQRFSVGHELGHWMRDRGKSLLAGCASTDMDKAWNQEQKTSETSANEYAANLLLPRHMFGPRAKDLPITLEATSSLAAEFQTSLTATAIRLVTLGTHMGIVSCFERQGRCWFYRHPELPKSLWFTKKVVDGTKAFDVLYRGKSDATGDVDADCWIDHKHAGQFVIHEEAIDVAKGVVLSLLWWKDSAQITKAMDDEDDGEEMDDAYSRFYR
jgi:Zn-dependent peptidase ImmA (M78 family)